MKKQFLFSLAIPAIILSLILSAPMFNSQKPEAEDNVAVETNPEVSETQTTTDFDDKVNSMMPTDKNYMFSPFSIRSAFGMLANGAKGQTQSEILSALDITDLDKFNKQNKALMESYAKSQGITLEVANSLWQNTDMTSVDFSKDYKDTIEQYFGGTASKVNNENGAGIINSWVNEKTHGKIKNIVDESNFLYCLVNSLYFKGQWMEQFSKEATNKQDFTSRDKTVKKVDMMHKTDYMSYCEKDGVQMVSLPYSRYSGEKQTGIGADVSMYIMLSDEKVENPVSLVRSNTMKYQKVRLSLPKFEASFNSGEINGGLDAIMQALGIKQVYAGDSDLTGLVEKGNVSLDYSVHKTYISVDEEGTEAAAVTALFVKGGSAFDETEPVTMNVNKPFTYVIYDNDNDTALFVGEYAFA